MNEQTNTPRRILIVGGGTAGWMTAALMAHHWASMGVEISLLESSTIGIIGVGEGATPKMRRFFQTLGIPDQEWMPACNATYKCGIRFPQWSTRPGYESYYHPFFTMSDDASIRAFHHNVTLRQQNIDVQANPDWFFLSNWVAKKRCAPLPDPRSRYESDYAYHFDARLIGEFLRHWASARGVRHLVDTVTRVQQTENGDIAGVETEQHGLVDADFFVDCTGFANLLSGKTLGVPFMSYKPWLFNDRAVAMPTPLENPQSLPSETLSTAMKCGWAWKIPLTNRYGNGYVYSSDFIEPDAAERELRAHLQLTDDSGEARHLQMRVGRLERTWERNCVAIGLAQGFVEPLEATALMIVQDTVEQFIASFGTARALERQRDEFNDKINRVYDSIRDYIQMHYKLNTRTDTAYWVAARDNPNVSDSVAAILATWDEGGDLLAEITRQRDRLAYSPTSWFCILGGMGRFPKKPRRATGKHQAVDPSVARKQCMEMLRYFPDHRQAVDEMAKVTAA